MENQINIRLYLKDSGSKSLLEATIPSAYADDKDLHYEHNEIYQHGGIITLKKWLMPGLYILWQETEASTQNLDTTIEITGAHILVTSFGHREIQAIDKQPMAVKQDLSGTLAIHRSASTLLHLYTTGGNKSKHLAIILSKTLLSQLLHSEYWFTKHRWQETLLTEIEVSHQYFLELPVQNILSALLNEHIPTPLKKYYFEMKLKELFFITHLQEETGDTSPKIPKEIQEKLLTAKSYLLTHYDQSPTIKQLSKIIVLNEFKLKYYFKMMFGITIKSYVIQLRMKQAKQLLWNRHSINTVATQLGYKNVSHFIFIFKRTFGETPRQMVPKLKT